MDRFEELKKYKELFDEGIITEEEFNALKKEFLSTPVFQTDVKSNNADNKAGDILKEITSEISDNVDGIKKDIAEDYKTLKEDGVKGIRKLSAGTVVAIAIVLCLVVVGSIVLASHHNADSSYSSSSSGSYSSGLSAEDIETLAKYGVIKEIKDQQKSSKWSSHIDPYSCYININTYSREDDNITAYGTVHFYDKYGNLVSKYISGSTYSSNFEITLSNSGRIESCKID